MKLTLSARIMLVNSGPAIVKETVIMPGDVNGTTIFTNGVKVHWAEGRGSWIAVTFPGRNSKVEWPVYEEAPKELEPYLNAVTGDDIGMNPMRPATAEEEKEWEESR